MNRFTVDSDSESEGTSRFTNLNVKYDIDESDLPLASRNYRTPTVIGLPRSSYHLQVATTVTYKN